MNEEETYRGLFEWMASFGISSPRAPERMDDEQIKNLARRIVQNEIYIPSSEDAMECSFGAMLKMVDWTDWDTSKIGLVYEEMHKAGPMAVNGFPMFLSLRMVHSDDTPALFDHVTAMLAALHQ